MVGSKEARKALVRALSKVVLSKETILVHAGSVLDQPELVASSLQSSARDLWSAVLERAQAEAAVEALVRSVLEDNPGAEPLRRALEDWQRAAQRAEPPPSSASIARDTTGRSTPASNKRSEQVRWGVLVLLCAGLAWQLVPKGSKPSGEPTRATPTAALLPGRAAAPPTSPAFDTQPAPPVQVGAALQPRAEALGEILPASDAGSVPEAQRLRELEPGAVQKGGRGGVPR